MLTFSWDPEKAESNRKKHGITFPEAATAFSDPLSLTIPDPEHSQEEARFVLVGLTFQDRLVVVAHGETDDEIRIISARLATRAERQAMSKSNEPEKPMRDEYDFGGGVRGKYASRFAEGTNIVVLDPDVAEVFGDAKAVNEALRLLASSVRKSEKEPAS